MSNPTRLLVPKACVHIAAAAALLLSPAVAHANGGVLSPASDVAPTTLDAEVAVAVTPFGTTRWTRLTVGGPARVMWLVPARPGAALDWAADGWLKTLEDATSPRVAPPTASPPCDMPSRPERVAPWSTTGAKKLPTAVAVHESENDARAHAAARGFALPAALGTKLAGVYAKGYALVSVELDARGASVVSSPTLRISDDGGAIVPLALTGSAQAAVRVTAFVITRGSAVLPLARELDPSALTWGRNYSTHANARASTLVAGGGAIWLREAASHEVLFEGLAVPRDTPIEPIVTGYFREATGQAQPACDAAARNAGYATGSVGRTCPAGAIARVPGGAACTPGGGTIDPASFTCGAGVDDLALALAGTAPSHTFITRFTGFVPQNGFGLDAAIATTTASQSPIVFAGRYEPCPVAAPPRGGGGGLTSPAPQPTSQAPQGRPHHYDYNHGGCSGSSTTVVYDDTGEEDAVGDEEYGSSTPSSETSTSTSDGGDACAGDTSSSSSSSGSGWDDDDDDDDSSSSSSESCDCGNGTGSSSSSSSSSSGSSSGWDDADMAARARSLSIGGEPDAGAASDAAGEPKNKGKKHPKKTSSAKKGKPSPVSRYALLFVALLLPLRRRLRAPKL